jgi:hypothetical protein
MKMSLTQSLAAFALAFLLAPVTAWAQDDVPHYCKTAAGVLGPYPNDGRVRVGDPCYGTRNGRRYEGTAVMSPGGDDKDNTGGGADRRNNSDDDAPHYCKTDAGVLGPYPNDGSVRVGDPCYGTRNGRRYEGVAVMSRTGEN